MKQSAENGHKIEKEVGGCIEMMGRGCCINLIFQLAKSEIK